MTALLQLAVFCVYCALSAATSTADSDGIIAPHRITQSTSETFTDTIKDLLRNAGLLLTAIFSLGALRQIVQAFTVNVHAPAERKVKEMSWRMRVCLLAGGVCLVAWAAMSAVSAAVQAVVLGVLGVGVWLVFGRRIRELIGLADLAEQADLVKSAV